MATRWTYPHSPDNDYTGFPDFTEDVLDRTDLPAITKAALIARYEQGEKVRVPMHDVLEATYCFAQKVED